MNHDPPGPRGLTVHRLTDGQVESVLTDVFTRGRRCRLLDTGTGDVPGSPGRPQWLLAELGDGRVTGACPGARWRRSDQPPTGEAPPPGPAGDRWRILEVLVFGPHAQVRVGEGAGAGWISADAPGPLPEWLRPRDRSFLLQGWNGPEYSRTLDGEVPLAVTREPSGTRAVLPVEWADFSGRPRPGPDGVTALESSGTWLTVREYWAEDPGTGAVGVAFHRLTGMRTGTKPTGPEFDVGTGDEISGRGLRW
ncbi:MULTISPECIES: hypothetical protein [Nocardiopsis]|uniref:Uncharacterized protein n=1 Tax=Nocardiopsis sinuspersici TaxID=501010 RepID=A0A1V3C1Q9_9ACTN|nr:MULTISPECIES: hypothetical protein [Nocardiopsis]OOC54588.1 hypothetical protein NOSIN_12830 [Nocardiopsis sinuspersici]